LGSAISSGQSLEGQHTIFFGPNMHFLFIFASKIKPNRVGTRGGVGVESETYHWSFFHTSGCGKFVVKTHELQI